MEIVEDFAKAFNDQQAHKEMNFEETEDNATEDDKFYTTNQGDKKVIPAKGKYRIPKSTRFV